MESSFQTKSDMEAQYRNVGIKATAAPPPLWEAPLAFPVCPLLLPHVSSVASPWAALTGSNLPFLVLNFGVWRAVVSPSSLLPVGPVPSRVAQGPAPRPCGQNSLAWGPAGQTEHSPLVLGSPESAPLPSGWSQSPASGSPQPQLPCPPLSSITATWFPSSFPAP